MIQCNITRVSFTRESKSSVWPPGIESPAKSLEMEEGSMDPEPLLCPAPLLLVSPGEGRKWRRRRKWREKRSGVGKIEMRKTDKNKDDRECNDDALR